ncbi:hypothetical protein SAMN04488498_10637 [Mesorhizobium albiziae]|uniref:Uncharacterized protein n=1 Tax=Neomesorhizobium albiziae TaxID=335020 RepID=A0A1I3Z9A6_9HYPH|nr:hypothetical protein [Mesorhizobium albiziae]GLS32093.1 hypothetical protein GCM10007937_38030 [Mesorhizobium albiziae]SFK40738.1 hypothetical protein SAMN04488498_10637 [Mesorhizobium albiziae]
MFERISIIATEIAGTIARGFPAAAVTEAACERWMRDPLSHPTLDAMSPLELADLPPAALRSYSRE